MDITKLTQKQAELFGKIKTYLDEHPDFGRLGIDCLEIYDITEEDEEEELDSELEYLPLIIKFNYDYIKECEEAEIDFYLKLYEEVQYAPLVKPNGESVEYGTCVSNFHFTKNGRIIFSSD